MYHCCPYQEAFLKGCPLGATSFGNVFGVEGMEPRIFSLEYTWLPTRVWSNAQMRTAVAV